jgi:hypothetical protein
MRLEEPNHSAGKLYTTAAIYKRMNDYRTPASLILYSFHSTTYIKLQNVYMHKVSNDDTTKADTEVSTPPIPKRDDIVKLPTVSHTNHPLN